MECSSTTTTAASFNDVVAAADNDRPNNNSNINNVDDVHKTNDTNNNNPKKKKSPRFDPNGITIIPNEFELTKEERRSNWYLKGDYMEFLKEIHATIVVTREEKAKKTTFTYSNPSVLHCTNGLEHLIDESNLTRKQRRRRITQKTIAEVQIGEMASWGGDFDISECLPRLYRSISMQCQKEALQRANAPFFAFKVVITNKKSSTSENEVREATAPIKSIQKKEKKEKVKPSATSKQKEATKSKKKEESTSSRNITKTILDVNSGVAILPYHSKNDGGSLTKRQENAPSA